MAAGGGVFSTGEGLLKEGLPADETELSARDLICSDQLKPSPERRVSDAVRFLEVMLACFPRDDGVAV